jgi:hypothetical protein
LLTGYSHKLLAQMDRFRKYRIFIDLKKRNQNGTYEAKLRKYELEETKKKLVETNSPVFKQTSIHKFFPQKKKFESKFQTVYHSNKSYSQ